MKSIESGILVIGAISMLIGIVIRLMAKQIALGLEPSSFLEFSIACFLLILALDAIGKK